MNKQIGSSASAPEKVQLKKVNNDTAPLEECQFKVLLELTGGHCGNDRRPLDLVAVIDVSGSMSWDKKLENVQKAMQFVIQKLGSNDRLGVVKFLEQAEVVHPLSNMDESTRKVISDKINGLVASGNETIASGLEVGLRLLPKQRDGRVVALMLLSDGCSQAPHVDLGDVPVYTFGFGKDHNPQVLNDIATSSKGGTFSYVENSDEATKAFSMCLGGLVTVVAQDLKLTVREIDGSTIKQVSSGSYPQSKASDSITITFSDLYSQEVRKVLVDLLLPAVESGSRSHVLSITCSNSTGKTLSESILRVRRLGNGTVTPERPEVTAEEIRIQAANMIKEAAAKPDGDNSARSKLVEILNRLEDGMLKSELQQLLDLMDLKQNPWLPFALSSGTSHDLQRFAARGNVDELRPFATPRMEKYCEQAESYDPKQTLTKADEDEKVEVAEARAGLAEALNNSVEAAIQTFQDMSAEDGLTPDVIEMYTEPTIETLEDAITMVDSLGTAGHAIASGFKQVITRLRGIEAVINKNPNKHVDIKAQARQGIKFLEALEKQIKKHC